MTCREPIAEPIFYVYAIVVDGVVRYIGKGKGRRAYEHLAAARRISEGIVPSRPLRVHRELAKHLHCNIEIVLLHEGLEESDAFDRERAEIASRRQDLWNAVAGGAGVSGLRFSPETIERLRESHRGQRPSPATIEKRRIALTGKRHTAEARAKMSAIQKVVKKGASTEHLRLANLGRKQTPEHIANAVRARTGLKRSMETRMRMRASQLGKQHSPETRAKISAAKKGRVYGPEERLIKYASRRKHPSKREGATS